MFCNKTDYKCIKRVHKRALRLTHFNFSLQYDDLLLLENTRSIHTKHLYFLMIETYKSVNKLNPEIMWDTIENKNVRYSLRSGSTLKLPSNNTTHFGLNSLKFRASLLWNLILGYIKNSDSVALFSKQLKTWNKLNSYCSCKICR